MKYYLIPFLLLTIISCKSFENTSIENETRIEKKEDPQIIFSNFKIKKIEENLIVTPINSLITKGQLKQKLPTNDKKEKDALIICQTDKNKSTINQYILSNPLIKTFETYSESGEFSKKTIYLDSIQFSLRMQLDLNTTYISIYQLIDTTNSTLIYQEEIIR
jgi:hypothetical protein